MILKTDIGYTTTRGIDLHVGGQDNSVTIEAGATLTAYSLDTDICDVSINGHTTQLELSEIENLIN